MTIRVKLFSLLFVTVLGFLTLTFFMNYFVVKINDLGHINTKVESLNSSMLMLRRGEKDFILRRDLKYRDKFNKTYNILKKEIITLEKLSDKYDMGKVLINDFRVQIEDYYKIFLMYVKVQEKIGLNEKVGLYGSLRDSVHKVQSFLKKIRYNNALVLVYELRKHEKDFMLRRNTKYLPKFDKVLSKLKFIIRSDKTHFSDDDKKLVYKYLDNYNKDFKNLVKEEINIGLTQKDGVQSKLRNSVHKTEDILSKLLIQSQKESKDAVDSIFNLSLIFALFIILIVAIYIFWINRGISGSIKKFQNGLISFFAYLNKTQEKVELLNDESKDEFGIMSKVVNENIKKVERTLRSDLDFLEEVSSIINEIQKGYLSTRLNNKVNSENLEKLRVAINSMLEDLNKKMGDDINEILEVLSSFSNLDFTKSIADKGSIPKALNSVTNIINDMLVHNKINGLTLQESADSFMNNVEKLSISSTQAASALEETAAALDEITSTITGNNQHILQMSNYAQNLTNSANEGEKLAKNTNISMEAINEQVSSINEAITVIDQIAFQTNILSLNAAVEAATAGEAGKGFAVVAQEVRNLASRSAEAAREIKSLVENATSKANEGKQIAHEMIKGYSGLGENLLKTMELIKEVESASKQQQIGIEQINSAVNDLDKQTQENANVALETRNIAQSTQNIAKEIVTDADNKKFKGKNEVKPKVIDINFASSNIINKKDEIKSDIIKHEKVNLTNNSIKNLKKNVEVQPKEIVSNVNDDEWESF